MYGRILKKTYVRTRPDVFQIPTILAYHTPRLQCNLVMLLLSLLASCAVYWHRQGVVLRLVVWAVLLLHYRQAVLSGSRQPNRRQLHSLTLDKHESNSEM